MELSEVLSLLSPSSLFRGYIVCFLCRRISYYEIYQKGVLLEALTELFRVAGSVFYFDQVYGDLFKSIYEVQIALVFVIKYYQSLKLGFNIIIYKKLLENYR